eukprot:1179653-Prorocentrum_minimum.AAC.4
MQIGALYYLRVIRRDLSSCLVPSCILHSPRTARKANPPKRRDLRAAMPAGIEEMSKEFLSSSRTEDQSSDDEVREECATCFHIKWYRYLVHYVNLCTRSSARDVSATIGLSQTRWHKPIIRQISGKICERECRWALTSKLPGV